MLEAPLLVCESPASAFSRVSRRGNDCLVRCVFHIPHPHPWKVSTFGTLCGCCVCTGQQVGKFSKTSAALRALPPPPPLALLCLLLMRGLPAQTYSTPEWEHMLEPSQRESRRTPGPDFLSLGGYFCLQLCALWV